METGPGAECGSAPVYPPMVQHGPETVQHKRTPCEQIKHRLLVVRQVHRPGTERWAWDSGH